MIKLVVEVEPLPQPRPRFSRGRCFQPKVITEYKAQIAQAARIAMKDKELMTGAVAMSIKLYRKFVATSRRFGDFDNHAKNICDACDKIVFADDSQIVSCTVEKFTDKENPRVEVTIEEI